MRALPKRARPAVESLEDRLAPDVSIGVIGGDLVVRGTAAADQLRITQHAPGAFAIAALGGTTFNGGRTSALFSGVSDDVRIDLGAGNDHLTLSGPAVAGRLLVAADHGDDVVQLLELQVSGRAEVTLGRGNDVINIGGSVFGNEVRIDGGRGDDLLNDLGFILDPGQDPPHGPNVFQGGHRLSSITVNRAAVGDGDLNVPPAEVIPQPDDTLLVKVTGTGSAAVLGAFTFAAEYIVDPQAGAIPRGVAVFCTAHGDLYLTFAGTFDQNNNFTGTYRITGGTGAYRGASGSGVNLGHINADRTFRVTFDGPLLFP